MPARTSPTLRLYEVIKAFSLLWVIKKELFDIVCFIIMYQCSWIHSIIGPLVFGNHDTYEGFFMFPTLNDVSLILVGLEGSCCSISVVPYLFIYLLIYLFIYLYISSFAKKVMFLVALVCLSEDITQKVINRLG